MDYKSSKEAFVSGATGSSIFHVNTISAVALSSIALHSALKTRLKRVNFIAEWLILVIPLILSITLFAGYPSLLSVVLLIPTGLIMLIPPREYRTFLPSSSRASSPAPPSHAPPPIRSIVTPLPALTTYRAHMMLMTILSILAVDFPVFPRSLAKCETFGVSLMDLGVGSCVFSQGIVSAIPLLKDPAHLSAPLLPKIITVTRKSFPVIVLGLVRVILVKGTEYPEHESEYGTHWNFFITLALLPILQVFLHPVIARTPLALLGVFLGLLHQIGLSFFGTQDFALTAPRTNVFSANKEGIISLPGYLAIHILGLSAGTLLLPPSPSHFRRQQQAYGHPIREKKTKDIVLEQRQDGKTAIELCSYTLLWWTFLGFVQMTGLGTGISRRIVNLPYILWVAAFNTSFILGYLVLDLFFFPPVRGSTSAKSETEKVGGPPSLLSAVNKNGLVLFLLANVATGLINLSLPTMYMHDTQAMLVLCAYALFICIIAWALRGRRVW